MRQDGAMDDVVARFAAARIDDSLVVLEGFHALKHALRFDAEIVVAIGDDAARLGDLADDLSPDVAGDMAHLVEQVPRAVLAAACPRRPATGVAAIAVRPRNETLDLAAPGPIVYLHHPNHLGNIGAVVRVAAALGSAGVVTSGERDPWHSDALRGSAGLHFALPVTRAEGPPEGGRALVALDPGGEPLADATVLDGAVLAFGGERHGLPGKIVASADRCIRIPMRRGVSSLNLATAVAIVLHAASRP